MYQTCSPRTNHPVKAFSSHLVLACDKLLLSCSCSNVVHSMFLYQCALMVFLIILKFRDINIRLKYYKIFQSCKEKAWNDFFDIKQKTEFYLTFKCSNKPIRIWMKEKRNRISRCIHLFSHCSYPVSSRF